ncbi:MAG TPA: glutathione S-transferase family protein [Steroidobacteraceae bacterium]|jgi:glutathione S-transferase|nr:glutathione S-transferase family protein [Steroidobacteraceae bacterium]
MADEIVFYTSPMSRGRMIQWMLEETGAPSRVELVDLQKNEQKNPKFLAINPMGKVPAIVHRGVVVTECAAICTYLADAFPAAQLAPKSDDPARGTYLRWMFFGAGCVDPGLMDRMLQRPTPERYQALGYGRFEDMIAVLEKAITPGPYILGERFSAADLYISAQIGFGLMTKTLEASPAFQAYAARCNDRPAYQRALAKTEELTVKMKAAS